MHLHAKLPWSWYPVFTQFTENKQTVAEKKNEESEEMKKTHHTTTYAYAFEY